MIFFQSGKEISVAKSQILKYHACYKQFQKKTRKYPLRGYILGVLTHTTAWDRHWEGDETLKLVLVYVA